MLIVFISNMLFGLACPLNEVSLPPNVQIHLTEYQLLKANIPDLNFAGGDEVYLHTVGTLLSSRLSAILNLSTTLTSQQRRILYDHFLTDIKKSKFAQSHKSLFDQFQFYFSEVNVPE